MSKQAAIALNRFGLGARPADAPPRDAKAWLTGQFDRYQPRPAAIAALPDARAAVADYAMGRRMSRGEEAEARMAMRRELRQDIQASYRAAVNARAAAAIVSDTPFVERLVHFWSNHFAVSAQKPQVTALAGAFEAEAIRPHVLGRFEDMLVAVERHPAMLIFLDQARSVGPESLFAGRAAERNAERKRGLNENLAREIMELHTLGVRTGYTQADVTEFARAMTGWTVGGFGPGARAADPGTFVFRPALHEPGARTIMGARYDQQGEAQARAVLAALANAPATADHIATKLARHFAGDDPPPALVRRLSDAFRRSRGDLPTVYRALIDAPETWVERPLKFKTPWEWLVSAMRGLGRTDLGQMQVAAMMNQLGQPIWRPGSPAGYDDIAASWAGPDALVRRVELAQRLVAPLGDRADPRALAGKLLPDAIGGATETAIGRAESAASGLSLLIVSPEFLRR